MADKILISVFTCTWHITEDRKKHLELHTIDQRLQQIYMYEKSQWYTALSLNFLHYSIGSFARNFQIGFHHNYECH